MDFDKVKLENGMLANRGNKAYMNEIIANMDLIKEKLDWQLTKFLDTYIKPTHESIDELSLDTSNPLYRYYNYKCGQYSEVERIIRVAKALS